jgi:ABC-type transporter Mla subunit MlaD
MSGGFKVVLPDLQTASGVFSSESKTLAAVMPMNGPGTPDGGSGEINGALQTLTEAIGGLNAQLSAVIAQHGQKLQTAHDNYAQVDTSLSELCHQLTLAGSAD